MVTVGKYVTPNHMDINGNGIEPDFPRLPGNLIHLLKKVKCASIYREYICSVEFSHESYIAMQLAKERMTSAVLALSCCRFVFWGTIFFKESSVIIFKQSHAYMLLTDLFFPFAARGDI